MAIFAPGALTGPISGTVAGLNFAHGPAGPYIRRTASRCDPRTAPQLAVRATYSAAAAAWRALTTIQRTGWRTTAARVSHTNRLGLRSPLSGWNLFLSRYLFPCPYGYGRPDIPPTGLHSAPPTSATLTLSSVADSTCNVVAPSASFPDHWHLSMARSCSNTPTTSLNYWRLVTMDPMFSFAVNIQDELNAVFSPLRQGEVFLSRVLVGSFDYAPSSSLTGTHTVA